MSQIIIWPDGSEKPAPANGYTYVHPDPTMIGWRFQWDESLNGWVDIYGDLCHFENHFLSGIGCWVAVKLPGGISAPLKSSVIVTSSDQPSLNNKASSPVKPPNPCECGAYAVRSNRHSSWCRLYKEYHD